MVFGRNGSRTLLNAEVGAAYKVRGDGAIAFIILEINQLKTYPYCGNLIIERGRAESTKNVPEQTRPIAFDMCGVSSDGKYRISDSQRIKTYSNEFVLKPTKSLRSLASKGGGF